MCLQHLHGQRDMALVTLKKRPEYLRIRGGLRWSGRPFLIECKLRPSQSEVGESPRFGFTVTKKLGNAVSRNRIRRRLKSAANELAPEFADPTCDYVIVARKPALDCDFQIIRNDMKAAFKKLKSKQKRHGNVAGSGTKRDGVT